jgi:hypothetical protein
MTNWQISGEYFETCSCDYLCPCITSNLASRPTQGHCTFAMVYHIERGQYDGTSLDDLSFALVGRSPEAMDKGNWAVGVITDDRSSADQQRALVAIASGQEGGPIGAVAPLVGQMLGVEARPIQYQQHGLERSVTIPGMLDQTCEGVPGADPNEPLVLDNTVHPANSRLALARATRSHLHVFGLDWDDPSGRNNGHFAPFTWQGS